MQTVSYAPVSICEHPLDALQRFHAAQGEDGSGVYVQALRELQAEAKQSHWIWFMLPQLRGLGRSPMAERYGIADLAEARAFLADPELRQRLEAVIAVVAEQLQRPGQTLPLLMGGDLDAAKTVSCLTIFAAAGLPDAEALLHQLNRRCHRTLALLQGSAGSGP
jgi:uncharacterized protein (DUF1810 family)